MSIHEHFNRLQFNFAVRSVLATPPVSFSGVDHTLLSMVQHRDLLPYLLALKSYCRYLRPARVVVVADPTLNPRDREVMRRHAPQIEFREAGEFRRQGIPSGGCWERLCAISDYVRDDYVIQLDADTVALQPLLEVLSAITDGTAFTLGTEDDMRIVSANEISAWARPRLGTHDHVQLVAEAQLDRIVAAANFRYVRGCAGFAGYPRASFDFDRLRDFSRAMEGLLPNRWSDWGTEQFSSNVLVASMPGARVLPHPKYCAPHRRLANTVFMHFIGYVRHATPFYARLATRISRELSVAARA